LAKNPDQFTVNERIHHGMYGLGTIKEVNQQYTTIEFDENGRRKFLTSIVRLERSSVAAPDPPPRKSRAKKVPGAPVAAKTTKAKKKAVSKEA
jgi:hypothetical protein